ncbi:MAG: peptidoglycan-binding domain-containing protein [Sulfitobacter sp.]
MTQATSFRAILALVSAGILSACLQSETVSEQGVVIGNGLAPPGAPAGTCWGKIPTPAVVETITEQILVTPAKTNPDGTLASLPVYKEESRQQIVTPRTDRWFEIPCPPAFTVEFVSTLQRALRVRGLYAGEVNGNLDTVTRRAVLALQTADGLPSDVLSIKTARELGIVAVPRS